jgi:hypothetical protein
VESSANQFFVAWLLVSSTLQVRCGSGVAALFFVPLVTPSISVLANAL